MAKAEIRAKKTGKLIRDGAHLLVSKETLAMPVKNGVKPCPIKMIIQLVAMILTVPFGLLITSDGHTTQGSGATAVFWAVLIGIFVAAGLYNIQSIFSLKETLGLVMKGISGLIPMSLLILFAFIMGNTCDVLGTGIYVSKTGNS